MTVLTTTEIPTVKEVPSRQATTVLSRFEYILSIANQMCIGFITIYMMWRCLHNQLQGISLHAFLVTIGFSFLMAEGIMCHYDNNVLTWSYRRKTKTTIHWVLMVLGGGCGVAGVIIQLVRDKFPLETVHGKLGFTAFILCLVNMLSGVVTLFSGRMRKLLSPLWSKFFHNFIGMACFIIALITQFYGYAHHPFSWFLDFEVLMKCLTLVTLVLTCIGPFKSLYNKLN